MAVSDLDEENSRLFDLGACKRASTSLANLERVSDEITTHAAKEVCRSSMGQPIIPRISFMKSDFVLRHEIT